jgi:predicted amidohydrolase YtcJ
MKTSKLKQVNVMADFIIVNGKVITVDEQFSIAEAVAVKDDKIVAVGNNNEIRKLVAKDTRILDLKGKTMLPGINDAHIHPSQYGVTLPPLSLVLGYPTVKSINDIKQAVKKRVEVVRPGEWIQGFGWDIGYLDESLKVKNKQPHKADLDPVSPANPVCLTDSSGHIIWVNSKALELAGLDRSTPDPDNGEIIRDRLTGEPTGILKEPGAHVMLQKVIPQWTREQKRESILTALKTLNMDGVTSITEGALGSEGLGLGGMGDSETLSVYNDLCNEDKLTARVNILLYFGEKSGDSFTAWKKGIDYIGVHTGFGNEWLRIAGAKIFADGVPPSKTSWMYDEYTGGGNGSLVLSGKTNEERYDELIKMILYGHAHGFQIGIHVTGDRAIDACLDGFIKAMQQQPWDARHYLIHGDFISEAAVRRMAENSIGVCVQTTLKWITSDLIDSFVNEKRSARQCPLKWLIDAGIHVTNSSDISVAYRNWKQGVQYAVLRESQSMGKISGPEQCISRENAIRMCTIEGAWQDHMETIKGSIEVGKLADFCVLEEDILTIDAHKIKDIPVLLTIVGGEIVYNKLENTD